LYRSSSVLLAPLAQTSCRRHLSIIARVSSRWLRPSAVRAPFAHAGICDTTLLSPLLCFLLPLLLRGAHRHCSVASRHLGVRYRHVFHRMVLLTEQRLAARPTRQP
jgi:hypothetical protein